MKTLLRVVGILALALAAGVVAWLLPGDTLKRFLEWVQGLGAWGPVIVALSYIPACLLFIPGSIITAGAGLLFGVVHGTIAVSLGSTAGAIAAFMMGRTLARGWIEPKVSGSQRFRALDDAIAERGFKIVLLARLSPVLPFNLLNYAFGITRVSLRDYALASWLGMFPGTLLYVYLGSAVKNVAELISGTTEQSNLQRGFFGLGLVVTVLVTVYITRVASQALSRAARVASDENRTVEGSAL